MFFASSGKLKELLPAFFTLAEVVICADKLFIGINANTTNAKNIFKRVLIFFL